MALITTGMASMLYIINLGKDVPFFSWLGLVMLLIIIATVVPLVLVSVKSDYISELPVGSIWWTILSAIVSSALLLSLSTTTEQTIRILLGIAPFTIIGIRSTQEIHACEPVGSKNPKKTE